MFQKATSLLSTRLLLLFALFVLTACAPVAPGAAQPAADTGATVKPVELRIGYQRGGAWTILKAQGTLEKRFGPAVTVTWTLFPAGPPLLEAMNAGSLDIGPTGETPPIFAQAAGNAAALADMLCIISCKKEDFIGFWYWYKKTCISQVSIGVEVLK